MMSFREVWIHCMDWPCVEIVGYDYARPRLLELIRSGYEVSCSVSDEEELTLFVTLVNRSIT